MSFNHQAPFGLACGVCPSPAGVQATCKLGLKVGSPCALFNVVVNPMWSPDGISQCRASTLGDLYLEHDSRRCSCVGPIVDVGQAGWLEVHEFRSLVWGTRHEYFHG